MLTKEEVMHVAHLARIEITEEELEKYQKDLKILFDEIDKIKDLNDFDEEKMMLVGEKNGISYRIGDSIRVKVIRASKEDKTIDFEIVRSNGDENKKGS